MIVPKKIEVGEEIRVISPSRSMTLIDEEILNFSKNCLEASSYKVTYSKNGMNGDHRHNSSVEDRVQDLHEAFLDKNVKGILTTIGGVNCNQLLDSLNYDLIKQNPKFLCGFSDITALQSAIWTKCSLVTFSGPHFSTLGMKQYSEYNMKYLRKMMCESEGFGYSPSKEWTDDLWFLDQENRRAIENKGPVTIQEGFSKGQILGGNLSTFVLLSGTPYMPNLSGSILFLEEDGSNKIESFDRNLQALSLRKDFKRIKGIVLGRFQKESHIDMHELIDLIKKKRSISKTIPIVANIDFGHTNPLITFPIGGYARLKAVLNQPIEFFISKTEQ